MASDVFKKCKPDLYWGARPEQIDRRVRQDLNHQIVRSMNDSYPATPNFFLETKGPNGSAAVKTRQACYAGAIGARAMHALQGYGQAEPTYDNEAYTIFSTYHDGTLKMYSHHPAQPSRPKSPQYYICSRPFQQLSHDGSPCIFCQVFVYQYKMHPIQNRWVEIVYLIDGEELDALKIFEFPKEYGNKAIPIEWGPRFTTKTSALSNKKSAFRLRFGKCEKPAFLTPQRRDSVLRRRPKELAWKEHNQDKLYTE
jgi:hypothetical protein